MTHWRAPHTDSEWQPGTGRWVEDSREGTISRDIMFAIIFGCVGILIGFGMGMVVS